MQKKNLSFESLHYKTTISNMFSSLNPSPHSAVIAAARGARSRVAWKRGSPMHEEVPLRRFAALPYRSVWKNKARTLHRHWLSPKEEAAGRFVPDAASESAAAVGLYSAFLLVCQGVSALFDVRRQSVSPRCSIPHRDCVLRNPPPCHPHLHATFLHPALSEGAAASTNNFYSGSLKVLRKSETLICSYIFS